MIAAGASRRPGALGVKIAVLDSGVNVNHPDLKAKLVPGHDFGLDLPPEDKTALIAFLRTL